MATVNLNPPADYQHYSLLSTKSGWLCNSIDYQVVTKSNGWNQGQTARLNEYQAGKDLGINYAAIAVPYDDVTKYTNYVTDARTKGLKVLHRSHWNAWQGDNGVGDIATATSLTSSGTTATCVTNTPHGVVTGQTISMNGMNETNYRGEFVVTVVNSTTFTYTMPGTASSPATGSIGWRYGRQTYLDKTYDFIVANSSLFQEGDMFGMCVEADQADATNMTFKTPGTTTFDTSIYNAFQKNQVTYANAAFTAIGLSHKVCVWPISQQLSNLNLNGQTLDSGSTGNSQGLGNADIVAYFGGILCTDHYLSDTYRYSTSPSYWSKYSSDLDKIHAAFPDCKLMVGEWGYHTTDTIPESERAGMYQQIINVLRSKDFIIGVNWWNHMGQTSSSIFTDNSGTLVTEGRTIARFIKDGFTTGNKAYGYRIRV